jgi:hypothetical protein
MAKYTDKEVKEFNTAKSKLEGYLIRLEQTHKTEILPNISEDEYTKRVGKIREQFDALKSGVGTKPAQELISACNRISANAHHLIEDITGQPLSKPTMFSRGQSQMTQQHEDAEVKPRPRK